MSAEPQPEPAASNAYEETADPEISGRQTPGRQTPGRQIAERPGPLTDPRLEETGETPPSPDLFPPDWDLANAVMAAVADPAVAKVLANVPPAAEQQAADPAPAVKETPPPLRVEETGVVPEIHSENVQPAIPGAHPPYLVPPYPSDGEAVYMLTILLRPSRDKVRDNIRIRQIYGTLITYPGKDRFAFQVFERGRGYLIEFPNFTTGLCPELINRLKAFIPAEQVRIEPITFQ
jgi:DNA polymerase-3 subunit alpha